MHVSTRYYFQAHLPKYTCFYTVLFAGTGTLTTDSSTGDLKVTTLTLAAVGSAIAVGNTGLTTVPTIGQVATFGNLWGGSAKFVQTGDPSGSDGANGDFWFKYEA